MYVCSSVSFFIDTLFARFRNSSYAGRSMCFLSVVFCLLLFTVPPFFSSLRDNKLSGAIPESLGNLVNLEELWLNANQIEGETESDVLIKITQIESNRVESIA